MRVPLLRTLLLALLFSCVDIHPSEVNAETYTLMHDFGVQGSHRRCKYSNGKVYALPKTATACFKAIESGVKAPEDKVRKSGQSESSAPSNGIWWRIVSENDCSDTMTPADVVSQLQNSGEELQIIRDGESVIVVVRPPNQATYKFFPTKMKCLAALGLPKPKPQVTARVEQCTDDALSDGQRIHNQLTRSKLRCDKYGTCEECVPHYFELLSVMDWDRRHPRCGPPLAGAKLLLSLAVQKLRAENCRY